MAGLGTTELLIILALVLLFFGGAKLPKLARSLGTAKAEFEQGQQAEALPADRQPVDDVA